VIPALNGTWGFLGDVPVEWFLNNGKNLVVEGIMVCEKCGEIINKGIKFCIKCGAKIQDAPGKWFLKVTGILFIIFAVMGIYVEVSLLIMAHSPILDTILDTIGYIFYIIIGISGIKYSKNIDRAKLLIFFVIILIAFKIVSLIIIYSISKFFPAPLYIIVFILPILILTILFLIGAYMNLKTKGGK
jgi:RNA polymerase subunit RPABC4/transcription elongation factor Spt4